MKRLLPFLAALAIIVLACAIFEAHLPENFCNDAGPREDSWLLKVTDRLSTNPEYDAGDKLATLYYGMVRVSAIFALSQQNWEFLKQWHSDIGEFYRNHAPDITYTDLIDAFFDETKYDARQIRLLKSIIIPNYGAFYSLVTIVAWDDCAFRSGWTNFGDLLAFDTPTAAKSYLEKTQ